MKTKVLIKTTARMLFNQKGVTNVTLRDVAAALNKSYGNITYHYASKELLLQDLYADMQGLLADIGARLTPHPLLLEAVMQAPMYTYALSRDYRFFYADFLELHRHYPALMEQVQAQQNQRMINFRSMLEDLQAQGLLRTDMPAGQLELLMQLSGLVRTYFFVDGQDEQLGSEAQLAYCAQVNAVLWPYLTPAGSAIYQSFQPQATDV